MKHPEFNPVAIAGTWTAFQKSVGGLAPICNEREYRKTVALLNELLDTVRGDEAHPLTPLMELVGDLVSFWEAREVPIPDAAPRDVLRMLMDANDLTQSELATDLGGQPVVSAILKGRRGINARQAAALAKRFNVSPAAFIG